MRTWVWVAQLCHGPLFVCHEIKLWLQSCITRQFYDVKLSETVQQQWQDISRWKRILNVVSFNTCPSVTHTTGNWTFEDCAPFPARHTFKISVLNNFSFLKIHLLRFVSLHFTIKEPCSFKFLTFKLTDRIQ